ncbi:MAG: hypothetical protein WCQ26_09010 [Pseudanabaena sp. ELA748]
MLLIQTKNPPMTHAQVYEFYLANHDLRIERTVNGEVEKSYS